MNLDTQPRHFSDISENAKCSLVRVRCFVLVSSHNSIIFHFHINSLFCTWHKIISLCKEYCIQLLFFPLLATHFLNLNLVKFCYRNCRSRMVSGLFRRKWDIPVHPTCTSNTNKCKLLRSHMVTHRLTTNNYAAVCSFGNTVTLRNAEVKSKTVHDTPDSSI